MKKIFIATAIFIASLFIFTSKTEVFAQESKGSITQVGFKDYFQKGKEFSKDKWENFQTIRDDYFAKPIEAKGITFIDEDGNKINRAYFSISSKFRINPSINIVNEDGRKIRVSSWVARGRDSQFLFVDTIGFTRAKTNFASGDNLLLPNDNFYVLVVRIPEGGRNSGEIWPIPVSQNEFKRLKALKKSAIGEKVTPIDGYNY